jgi:transglutaminase-like putative cysteine protease
MMITRRAVWQLAGFSLFGAMGGVLPARANVDSSSPAWRLFEIATKLALHDRNSAAKVWIPIPSMREASWHLPESTRWTTNATHAEITKVGPYGAALVLAEWTETQEHRTIEIVNRVRVRERTSVVADNPSLLDDDTRQLYLKPTKLIPTDGIVHEKALSITRGATTDHEKVTAIYDWVVENTFRDAKVAGCGVGDIVSMLRTGRLGGKCVDINGLFVGLVRSVGIPARDIYGIRVAPSKLAFRSLGLASNNATAAQHCRSEVYLARTGWTPFDPADVRKVVLEEPPGNLSLDDPKVIRARKYLLGSFDGNWIGYNMAHDISLPGSHGPDQGFFMYPQAEIDGERLDCLTAEEFSYEITAKEL